VTFVDQNALKIVGGSVVNEGSWPSTAYVRMTYRTDIYFGQNKITRDFSSICGGTLIRRNAVLTAAHCIVRRFRYVYDGQEYFANVVPNSYYPTYGSMFKVFLGSISSNIYLKFLKYKQK